MMCQSLDFVNASGSRSSRSAPIAVSARQYQSLLHDLRKHGISIRRSSSQQCNRAAKSRGKRGAGSEVARDEWWYDERGRRCKQSARSRARLVIPVYVSPLLQVWRSAAAQSRARRFILQSVVPVSIPWLLSQWRGECLSHAPVVLYPDIHVAPFTPPCAISSSVALRVVQRRCLRHHVPTLPAAFKLVGCTLVPLRTVVRRWRQCQPRRAKTANPTGALKLLHAVHIHSSACGAEAVVELWALRFPYDSSMFPARGRRLLDFRVDSLRQVPQLYRCRYLRVRQTVKFRCLLVPLLVFVHRWWDYHLQPHPTDRPHLYAGKYTEDYLLSVSRVFDGPTSKMVIPSGWFYCLVGCKRLFPCKFMSEKGCFCFMCEDDCDY